MISRWSQDQTLLWLRLVLSWLTASKIRTLYKKLIKLYPKILIQSGITINAQAKIWDSLSLSLLLFMYRGMVCTELLQTGTLVAFGGLWWSSVAFDCFRLLLVAFGCLRCYMICLICYYVKYYCKKTKGLYAETCCSLLCLAKCFNIVE